MTTATTSGPRFRWELRDLVLIAVLGAVFGFLYWALVQAWSGLQVAMGPFGDLAQNVLIGGWMVVAPLAIYILRRPGVGIVTEILAAFVEFAFLGSPVGPTLLLVGFIQGAGAEVAFTATGYRRYGWPTFIVSGVTAAVANFAYGAYRFGWIGQDLIELRVVLQLASGILLCGVLAKVIGDALLRTGVLDDLPIGRAKRQGGRAERDAARDAHRDELAGTDA